jgi:hypothetical protein
MRCDHHPLTTDVSTGFDRSLTVTQEDAIAAAVRAWVSEMLAGSHSVANDSDNP